VIGILPGQGKEGRRHVGARSPLVIMLKRGGEGKREIGDRYPPAHMGVREEGGKKIAASPIEKKRGSSDLVARRPRKPVHMLCTFSVRGEKKKVDFGVS